MPFFSFLIIRRIVDARTCVASTQNVLCSDLCTGFKNLKTWRVSNPRRDDVFLPFSLLFYLLYFYVFEYIYATFFFSAFLILKHINDLTYFRNKHVLITVKL